MMDDDDKSPDSETPSTNGKADATATKKPPKAKKKSPPTEKQKGSGAKGKKEPKEEKKRRSTLFPGCSFNEALELAETIQQIGGGLRVRRLTVFDHLGRSPESSASRQLITNSARYGLTTGNYQSEFLELTADGITVISSEAPAAEVVRARLRLAIEGIAPFKLLYDQSVGKRLPSPAVMGIF